MSKRNPHDRLIKNYTLVEVFAQRYKVAEPLGALVVAARDSLEKTESGNPEDDRWHGFLSDVATATIHARDPEHVINIAASLIPDQLSLENGSN